jgi:hypothetical protein
MSLSNRSFATAFPGSAAASLAALAIAVALCLSACKEDCSAAARMGDFEASQGNWVNAVKHYEKALRADAKCGVVGEKLVEAKRKVAAGK